MYTPVVDVESPMSRTDEQTSITGNDEYCCVICMESGNISDLIAPCVCMTHIHRKCLDTWRVTAGVPQAMTHCSVCKAAFEYEEVSGVGSSKAKELRFKRAVRRELVKRVVFTILAVCICSLAVLGLDRGTPKFMHLNWYAWDGKIEDFFPHTWPAPVVYITCGILSTLFITGLFGICSGLISWCTRSADPSVFQGYQRGHMSRRNDTGCCRGGGGGGDTNIILCCNGGNSNRDTDWGYHRSGTRCSCCDCSDCCIGYVHGCNCGVVDCGDCDCCSNHDGGCGDCNHSGGGGGGGAQDAGECGGVLLVFAIVAAVVVVLVGVSMMFMFLTGAATRIVERQCETMQQEVVAEYKRVKDLRPLPVATPL